MAQRSKDETGEFSEKEKQAWLDEKRSREQRSTRIARPTPVAVCVSCQNPFGFSEGVITDEVALCDVCAGD